MIVTILGTGIVGQTLSEKFISQGHNVIIGTRNVQDKLSESSQSKFSIWLEKNSNAQLKTFNEAVKLGDIIINALNGGVSVNVFKSIEPEGFDNKIILDISNPLDFSKGFPPSLIEGLNNSNSLGEEIQSLIPNSKVVKTLNTMWCGLMLSPNLINNGEHTNFICGNDQNSKESVIQLLMSFGWKKENIIDLGDISNSRGTESYLLLWTRIYKAINNGAFSLQIVQ